MTRLTFGVCASSFSANMALRQNTLDNQQECPQAAKATLESFYVDDVLLGEDSDDNGIRLHKELQHLCSLGGFEKFRKWKTSDRAVDRSVPECLSDKQPSCLIQYSEHFTNVLGVEWNATTDTFRPKVSTHCTPD